MLFVVWCNSILNTPCFTHHQTEFRLMGMMTMECASTRALKARQQWLTCNSNTLVNDYTECFVETKLRLIELFLHLFLWLSLFSLKKICVPTFIPSASQFIS